MNNIMNEKGIIGGAVLALIAVAVILYALNGNPPPTSNLPEETENGIASGPNVPFAECLKDSGATFYGAFWCPHCKQQKDIFGDAAPALPYVECSTPDGESQMEVCKDKKIESYPTWEFKDGTRTTGEQSFAQLAEKTGCTAPLATEAS